MKLHLNDPVHQAVEWLSERDEEKIEVVNDQGEIVSKLSKEEVQLILKNESMSHTLGDMLHGQSASDPNQYKDILQSPFFNDIINSLYDGVFITNGDGITVLINRSYERITDLKSEQLIGLHMSEIIEADYISKSASLQVIKEKRPVTLMQQISNGRNIIVSGTPIFSKNQEILYVVNSVRDITELLQLKHDMEDLQELKNLRQSSKEAYSKSDSSPFYTSEKMKSIMTLIKRAAKTDAKVLLHGETGVGKTMIAKQIHELSNRADQNFLELNCGALPSSLIEAELFGYEPGAFTGALKKGKKGLLEVADHGTLFLDEIGDLPLDLQVKLLKVIEDQAFYPVGSSTLKHIHVRLIAASHKDLKKLVASGDFREDLYYRLNVVPLHIPPLRERRKEIIPLARLFAEEFSGTYEIERTLHVDVLELLYDYDWPGNIRELKNLIEQLVVLAPDKEITRDLLPEELLPTGQQRMSDLDDIVPLKAAVENIEREMITKALKKYKTTRKAAEALEVSQSTIVQKMKKWEK
ncbi:sigma 54-interacting transcriptional regulator [Halobacillus sp. Cin3]|uniref:sigma-54 interaction domain-containing protein n=1 Tax=Halobacillus sp. Cin3 TaxID=2928441 RepID=UPI00248D578A|nr:sigma 54-interacting transcriptional regulator [Halobacillus sp. Cin3]